MMTPCPIEFARPSRALRRGATAMLCVVLAACATPPSPETADGSAPSASPREAARASAAEGGTSRRLGPPATNFVGKSVEKLEELTGPAALIRREGGNEFRRYDLGDCRAYATVVPAGGNVIALTTGPAAVGADVKPFEECSAASGG